MVQKTKTQMNQMIQWESYRRSTEEAIEEVKNEIKLKTETERAKLKAYRKNLNVANWKIKQLFDSINERVEAEEEMETVLTLDDFDVEGKNIDIELAEGEMKEAMKKDD